MSNVAVDHVEIYLRTFGVLVSRVWLEQCVHFIHATAGGAALSNEGLCSAVYRAFLDCDLHLSRPAAPHRGRGWLSTGSWAACRFLPLAEALRTAPLEPPQRRARVGAPSHAPSRPLECTVDVLIPSNGPAPALQGSPVSTHPGALTSS
ncbi:MAG: hypothetical protein EOO70_04695 [Myxococcaceae bacterium]|nr:MAG: hypothetical protein EOO70_04695 [Myxococcaceae bacterium]